MYKDNKLNAIHNGILNIMTFHYQNEIIKTIIENWYIWHKPNKTITIMINSSMY